MSRFFQWSREEWRAGQAQTKSEQSEQGGGGWKRQQGALRVEAEEMESLPQMESRPDETAPDVLNPGSHEQGEGRSRHSLQLPKTRFTKGDRCHLTYLFGASIQHVLNQGQAVGVCDEEKRAS